MWSEGMTVAATIPIGATATQEVTVTREMTVAHYQPHMPEVYGTPIMIYHMEVAAAAAIQPYLPAGWVSVGVAVNVRHLAPTKVGQTVSVTATVISSSPSKITFEVRAREVVVGEGTHVRSPVEMERFLRGIATGKGSRL
jgi:fluoroacetyl-CoA thioesterase